mmetsp:Transcript_38507/g.84125  ORF Transcript_38507/g.84125 Transcript_38507/m.84125 type:complete len:104 (+) Transcript_38507:56-367(+)
MFVRSSIRRLPVFGMGIGSNLPLPKAPSKEIVFHSQMIRPEYSLDQGRWWFLFGCANLGLYLGNHLYTGVVMGKNPANPIRNPTDPLEQPPKKHMHEVEEEDE